MSDAGISFRQLRYFVAVAQAKSFSAAARELNISQPALGLQVKDLETRVGVSLLDRHARGAMLTPAGECFLPHALETLAALGRAAQSVAPFRTPAREPIRLGVTPTLGRVLLEDLMDDDKHPGATLNLLEALTSELVQRLQKGEIDAAFCYDPPDDARYEKIALFEEDLVLVGRPDLSGFGEGVEVTALGRFPMALGPRQDATRQAIDRAAAAFGVQLDVRAEIAPTSLKREMLIRRGLCSIVPYGLFLPDIQAGLLLSAPIHPAIRRTMVLASRSELSPTALKALTDLARKAINFRVSQGQLGWRLLD
ncbi:MAG: transcriptional regulator [Hyphomicrobiales bacterium]|nr:transcriptional regulator [Hyphomicrobiales bacterium]